MKNNKIQLWKLSIALVVLTSLLAVIFILVVYRKKNSSVETQTNVVCGVIDLNEQSP